jgi:hypothetical protein
VRSRPGYFFESSAGSNRSLICWAISDSSRSGCSDDIVGLFVNSMAVLGATVFMASTLRKQQRRCLGADARPSVGDARRETQAKRQLRWTGILYGDRQIPASRGRRPRTPGAAEAYRHDQADHLSSSRRASSSLRRSATSAARGGSSVFAIGLPSCFLIFLPSAVTGKSAGFSGFLEVDMTSSSCRHDSTPSRKTRRLSSNRSLFRRLPRQVYSTLVFSVVCGPLPRSRPAALPLSLRGMPNEMH